MDDRLPVAGRLRQPRRARDDRIKNLLAEMLPHLAQHLLREPRAPVEHRHHHAQQFQPRVHPRFPHLPQHAMDHRDPLQRVILALQRHQQRIRRGKRVQRENPQRRRAINDDQIKPLRLADRLQRQREPLQMILHPRQLDLRAAQIHLAGHHLQPRERRGLDAPD